MPPATEKLGVIAQGPPTEPTDHRPLLDWFHRHQRALPWRTHPSLYATVVSEIMLQQTQVATVLPYFDRWMTAFPGFAALSAADESAVLRQWEGLGYYRRARFLHRLAQEWVALPEAERPTTAAQWLKLTGIGRYTAAAIASIHFGEPVAVVDGNVVRVLARLFALETTFPSNAAAVEAVRPLADRLIRNCPHPGDWNQALMELGATVCQRGQPQCLLCPLKPHCAAARGGLAAELPRLAPKPTTTVTVERLLLHRADGHSLLRQIPNNARRLAGLWEIPTRAAVTTLVGPLAPPADCPPATSATTTRPNLTQKRAIANERITECFFTIEVEGPPTPESTLPEQLSPQLTLPDGFAWIPADQLPALTLAGPHRRALQKLLTILQAPE